MSNTFEEKEIHRVDLVEETKSANFEGAVAYKVRDKDTGLFASSINFKDWSKRGIYWRSLTNVKNSLEHYLLRDVYTAYRTAYFLPKPTASFDSEKKGKELVSFPNWEIVPFKLQEASPPANLRDMMSHTVRQQVLARKYGWEVIRLIDKLRVNKNSEFRYILVFDFSKEFNGDKDKWIKMNDFWKEVRLHLKSQDVNRTKYRYTGYVMAFKDKEDAVLTRLAFADHIKYVLDYESLLTTTPEELSKYE